MLQGLYRILSIYSNGYIREEIVILKITLGLLTVGLTIYGAATNLAVFVFALSVLIFDYLVYRVYMMERLHEVEKYAKRFDFNKLLDAEGAHRPITEDELRNPVCTEETKHILENIRNRSFEEASLALDLGCGSGMLTVGLLQIGIRVISLDVTPRALKLTGEVAKRQGLSTERILAEAQHLPFKDACFEWVVASSVIEHLPDDIQGFGEAARALKRGGTAVFSFPSIHSPVFSLHGFLFNPLILFERLLSWKIPSVLPKRSKFVYLGELFLDAKKVFFQDVSIHRSYEQESVRRILRNLGFIVELNGLLAARGGRLASARLQNLVRHHPYFAHVFIVFGLSVE